MYLLNLIVRPVVLGIYILFTFHYVSIKSKCMEIKGAHVDKFTFHYVSIKSLYRCAPTIIIKIYIPLFDRSLEHGDGRAQVVRERRVQTTARFGRAP